MKKLILILVQSLISFFSFSQTQEPLILKLYVINVKSISNSARIFNQDYTRTVDSIVNNESFASQIGIFYSITDNYKPVKITFKYLDGSYETYKISRKIHDEMSEKTTYQFLGQESVGFISFLNNEKLKVGIPKGKYFFIWEASLID